MVLTQMLKEFNVFDGFMFATCGWVDFMGVLLCFVFVFVFVFYFLFFASWCTDDGYGWWSQQICVVVVEALVNEFKVERRGRLWDYRS